MRRILLQSNRRNVNLASTSLVNSFWRSSPPHSFDFQKFVLKFVSSRQYIVTCQIFFVWNASIKRRHATFGTMGFVGPSNNLESTNFYIRLKNLNCFFCTSLSLCSYSLMNISRFLHVKNCKVWQDIFLSLLPVFCLTICYPKFIGKQFCSHYTDLIICIKLSFLFYLFVSSCYWKIILFLYLYFVLWAALSSNLFVFLFVFCPVKVVKVTTTFFLFFSTNVESSYSHLGRVSSQVGSQNNKI